MMSRQGSREHRGETGGRGRVSSAEQILFLACLPAVLSVCDRFCCRAAAASGFDPFIVPVGAEKRYSIVSAC